MLHVRHSYCCNFCRRLPNDDVSFHVSGLTTTRAGSNKSFILCLYENHSYQAREKVLRLFCSTWPIWNIRKKLNLMQNSVLMDTFVAESRRRFLKSILLECVQGSFHGRTSYLGFVCWFHFSGLTCSRVPKCITLRPLTGL